MSKGLEIFIRDMQEVTEMRIRKAYEELDARGVVSPIEKYFVLALSEGCLVLANKTRKVRTLAWANKPMSEEELEVGTIHVWAQERALDWRADFVLGTLNKKGERCFAVVECDGHDFHERTKEQAERDRSRDRRVQEMGWRMFRFTGSELYRDAAPLVMDTVFNGWALILWLEGNQ